MIKAVAIGNLLMGDDGIAIRIIDVISEKIQRLGVECIKAETDVDYAIDNIEDGDFLFILDSTSKKNTKYGEVIEIPIEQAINEEKSYFTAHSMSLISLIRNLNIKVHGIIVAVKAASVEFGFDLSMELQNEFFVICNTVYDIIAENILEYRRKEEENA